MQAEWGLAQTLDSTMGFQKPMVASAWKNDSLFVIWATEIARQMKMLGFNLNLAPNADNEVFPGDYLRYFSNEQGRVARNAVAFTKTLQREGILTLAKHLPRRQMVENKDSTLIINIARIDTAGLYTLQRLIENKVDGILTNYLHFSLQNEKGIVPASLSQIFITEVLKRKLNFRGLVFTEVKNFQKTAGKIRAGDAEQLAFETGNDILMSPLNVRAGIKSIAKRMKKDKLLQQQLDVTVKKILGAKYDAGLNKFEVPDTDNLLRKLHSPASQLLKRQLAEASITVIKNENDLLPIRVLENNSFKCISVGKDAENEFSHFLKKYTHVESTSIKNAQDTISIDLKSGETLIVGIFPFMTKLESQVSHWIKSLSSTHRVIIVHFGSPFSIGPYMNATSLITAYTDQDEMMTVVAQMIFGALPATGVLPVRLKEVVVQPLTTKKK
ncbi:MAG: glycoside hydrolase family 3 N-terminal domain-containing protein [Bacteroidota bacterium]